MRILFLGTGEIGLPTLRSLLADPLHTVVGCVTQPDKPVGRRQELQAPEVKRVALCAGIPVFQPERVRAPEALEKLRELEPDVIVVVAYGQILPRVLLEMPRVACLNLHASLLPRHRGASPIHAAIEAGDRETGMTVMYMAEGLDAGDVLLEKVLPIRRRETAGTLHDRLAEIGPGALREALALLEAGGAPRIPQDPSRVTYAGKLGREHGRIDWEMGCVEVERKIRAMNPWPAAHTVLPLGTGVKVLKVFRAIAVRRATGIPGCVLKSGPDGLLVAAGSGSVLVREVQLEGKKRMEAGEFLRGHSVEPGTLLGGVGL
jgi:methionyl-tRNA formyltransferase